MIMVSSWFGSTITLIPFQFYNNKLNKIPTIVTFSCRNKDKDKDHVPLSVASAYDVLGVNPDCSVFDIKAAFRSKVKQFHPDVNRDEGNSDAMIRSVIQAYQILSNYTKAEIIERECLDPFDTPECEAYDLFVNELLCVGKGSVCELGFGEGMEMGGLRDIKYTGCSNSCVERSPHAFTYVSSTGTARASSQGHSDDYRVQYAVGQCPRSCIHYVTPSQRIILEELLDSVLGVPYDTSAEADMLYSLITKAKFENNRYQKPKKQPKSSSQHVDLF